MTNKELLMAVRLFSLRIGQNEQTASQEIKQATETCLDFCFENKIKYTLKFESRGARSRNIVWDDCHHRGYQTVFSPGLYMMKPDKTMPERPIVVMVRLNHKVTRSLHGVFIHPSAASIAVACLRDEIIDITRIVLPWSINPPESMFPGWTRKRHRLVDHLIPVAWTPRAELAVTAWNHLLSQFTEEEILYSLGEIKAERRITRHKRNQRLDYDRMPEL